MKIFQIILLNNTFISAVQLSDLACATLMYGYDTDDCCIIYDETDVNSGITTSLVHAPNETTALTLLLDDITA